MHPGIYILMLGFTVVACQEGPTFNNTVSDDDKGYAIVGPEEDHPPVGSDQKYPTQPSTSESKKEDVINTSNEGLTESDILQLDVVTINGNGGLVKGSADFDQRYLDPNGKPLNNPDNALTLKVGQTLSVCNQSSATRGLTIHTNGSPFPHGRNISPGSCKDYQVGREFRANGNNMYDHNLGGRFGDRDYPIYVNVISAEEAKSR